jgi:hypothetical protein
MYHQSPAEDLQFALEVTPQSVAASTAVNGIGVDMKGFDGVLFVVFKGAGNQTLDMKAQSDVVSGFGTAADIASAAITQLATGANNIGAILDVWRPTKRFVRAVVTTGAGVTLDIVSVMSIRYRRSGLIPATLDATISQLVKIQQN